MSSKIFNTNRGAKVKKSAFDLSHERKLSTKMGYLTPVLLQECVPGDKFTIDTQSMIRFAPLVSPVMHRINAYIHYFFVPSRILWENWEKFITNDIQTPVPLCRIDAAEIKEGSLADHLGMPIGDFTGSNLAVSKLPFWAYYQIWNDYYRDENLNTEIDYANLQDDVLLEAIPEIRAWEKDYFTSALPWAQKGAAVTMDANIQYNSSTKVGSTYNLDGSINPAPTGKSLLTDDIAQGNGEVMMVDSDGNSVIIDNIQGVNIEVEELRRATRLQRWLERNARSGSRYVEHLLSHWGVRSSDARLQRAEYIGGGKSPVVISEVLNSNGSFDSTTGDPTSPPQGYMSGHGINVGRTNHAVKYCEEHGYIMAIMSVLPEPTYQQGLPKLFMRHLNLDYYYPEFAQLGEQPVANYELYLGTDDDDNEATFGYQSRYAEYKYQQSTVHGQFKTTLDFWHAGRKFANPPSLTAEFIKADCQDINERIFAVTEETAENLYVQLYHKISAYRPLPFFNDPKL